MSESARIEFGQPYEIELPEEKLPPKILDNPDKVPLDSPFQVFIVEQTRHLIWEHARQSPQHECAGVLVGHPFRTPDGMTTFVVVTAAVRFTTPDASLVHVIITPEASTKARAVIEQEYPGLRPVGWYHSHPGHGIFLSGDDSVITESIFNADWHLALVVDPIREIDGVFRGPQQESVGYMIVRQTPVTVWAIAQYNIALDLWERGRPQEATPILARLQEQVKTGNDGGELDLWRKKGGYRNGAWYLEQVGYSSADFSATQPASETETKGSQPVAALARLYSLGKDRAKQHDWYQSLTYFRAAANIDPDYKDLQDLITIAETGVNKTKRPESFLERFKGRKKTSGTPPVRHPKG